MLNDRTGSLEPGSHDGHDNRGLALLPLALAADKPGSEIQAPMSIVILGGLVTATFLTLIVVPVLFSKWGRAEAAR